MDSIVDLLGIGASAASGGIFGILGNAVSGFLKAKTVKEEREYELKCRTLDAAAQERAHFHEKEMAELLHSNNAEAARQELSAKGLVASIQADCTIPASQWANNIKVIYRPFLTTLLFVACMYIFHLMMGALNTEGLLAEAFSKGELLELIRYQVYAMFFTASMAASWWFGERGMSPPNLK